MLQGDLLFGSVVLLADVIGQSSMSARHKREEP